MLRCYAVGVAVDGGVDKAFRTDFQQNRSTKLYNLAGWRRELTPRKRLRYQGCRGEIKARYWPG